MRNRKTQREIRHAIGRASKCEGQERDFGQERLDARNYYGNGDPTPQKAVRNIIEREKVTARLIRKRAVSQARQTVNG